MEKIFHLLSQADQEVIIGILNKNAESLSQSAYEYDWGDDSPIDNDNPHRDNHNKVVPVLNALKKIYRGEKCE